MNEIEQHRALVEMLMAAVKMHAEKFGTSTSTSIVGLADTIGQLTAATSGDPQKAMACVANMLLQHPACKARAA